LIVTTDHGTVNVSQHVEVIGDRETSVNLRYKTGRSLSFPPKKVFEISKPEKIQLPKTSLNSSFIFAKDYSYFVYPKNYHHFATLFNNTYQHGGISMEEIIIPFVILQPKK
jgi:hypothetical protein